VKIGAQGDGYIEVYISPRLKPYLLKVKADFFQLRLTNVMSLRSGYAIKLYQWAKRWEFAKKRGIQVDELRQVLGAAELDKDGEILKCHLLAYCDLKKRAILPAVKEINEKTDLRLGFSETRASGAKTVTSLVFTFASKSPRTEAPLPVPIPVLAPTIALSVSPEEKAPRPTQLDLPIDSTQSPGPEKEIVASIRSHYRLNEKQAVLAEKALAMNGIPWMIEKVACIEMRELDNPSRAFMAAIRDDWKAPPRWQAPKWLQKYMPAKSPAKKGPAQPLPPRLPEAEEAEIRKKASQGLREFLARSRGGG